VLLILVVFCIALFTLFLFDLCFVPNIVCVSGLSIVDCPSVFSNVNWQLMAHILRLSRKEQGYNILKPVSYSGTTVSWHLKNLRQAVLLPPFSKTDIPENLHHTMKPETFIIHWNLRKLTYLKTYIIYNLRLFHCKIQVLRYYSLVLSFITDRNFTAIDWMSNAADVL
jgi:hypothetical protein